MEKPLSNRKRRRNKNRTAPDKHLNRQKARDKRYKKRFKKLLKRGYVVITDAEANILHHYGGQDLTEGVRHSLGTYLFVAPRWAADIINHPQFSQVMLLDAKRRMEYRKEVVMEARLLTREILDRNNRRRSLVARDAV